MKIGIFSGSFDPVHQGHLAFANAALTEAGLDTVVFLPEAEPRHKIGVTALQDRVEMLKLALAGNANFSVLELPVRQFTLKTVIPKLKKQFADDQLFLLMGSDVYEHLGTWADLADFTNDFQVIVGRSADAEEPKTFGVEVRTVWIGHDDHEHSSSQVRDGFSEPLEAIQGYIESSGLYA